MPSTPSKAGSGVVALSLHANNNDINWNLNLDNNMEGLIWKCVGINLKWCLVALHCIDLSLCSSIAVPK